MAGPNTQLFKGSALVATVAAAVAAATPGGQVVAAFLFNFAATYAMGKWAQTAAARGFQQEVLERRAMIRSATVPQRIVWGHALVSGAVPYGQVTGADKEFMHLVIALAGHEIHSSGEIWFDDQLLGARDGSGNVTSGTFAGLARIRTYLGTAGQTADTDLISESGGKWTAAHKGANIAYTYARLKWDIDKFPNGIPNIRILVRGRKCFDPRDGGTRLTTNPALILRDYYTAEWGLGCTADEIDDTACALAANICDEWVDTGIDGVAITADSAADTFALAAHDPRLSTGDRVVLAGTTAPAGLALATQYYLVRTGATTVRLASTHQDAIEGNTLTFTTNGAGLVLNDVFQRRYAFNGSVGLDRQPPEIDTLIRTAMAGTMVWSAGKWRMRAGAYVAPGVDDVLGEDDLRGPKVYTRHRSRHELTNRVNGIYVDPGQDWAAVDYPPVTSSIYVAQDNGEVIARDMEFAAEINALRAQRLAKIALNRSRTAQLALPCKLSALRFIAADTVTVNLPGLDINGQVFRIVGLKITGADGAIGVDLQLEVDSAEIYDWATSDGVAPPINSGVSLIDPRVVGAPTVLGITSGSSDLLAAADGTIISRMRVTWVHAVEPNPLQYEVQWKRSTDTDYESRDVPRTENATYIAPVEDGATYDVRVRTRNVLGVRSAWLTGSHVVVGKTAPATAPTSLAVVAAVGGYDIAVSACPDADYARTEIWEATSNDRALATLLFNGPGTRFARTGLPGSVSRWFWSRHVDRSGNASAWFPLSATGGITAVTLSPSGGGVPVVTSASTITAGTGSPPPGGADFWAVFSNHDGKLWRWNQPAGVYTAAVDGADVLANTIAANKLAVAQLAAISADLGDVTAGSINIGGGKFSVDRSGNVVVRSATSGARLEVTNSVIRVYDSSGTLRVKLGDLA